MTIKRNSVKLNVPEIIEIGHAGKVAHINAAVVNMLVADDFIPVIAPLVSMKKGSLTISMLTWSLVN